MLKQILNELNFTIDTNTIEDYLPDEEIISMKNTTEEKSKREIKKAEKEIEEIKQIKEDFFSNTIAEREFQWGKCFESKEMQRGYIPNGGQPVQWIPNGERPSVLSFSIAEQGVPLINQFKPLKANGYKA